MNKGQGRFQSSFISLLLIAVLVLPTVGSCLCSGGDDGAAREGVLAFYDDHASPVPIGGHSLSLDHYAEGNGSLTYAWTYDYDDYSVSFDLSYEQYSYYVDLETERYMTILSDRDNALNFITVDDSVIVFLAERMDDLGEQAGLDEAELASLVLTFVQTLPYATDAVTHSMTDYWSFPVETLYEGSGDCEDTSFLYSTLMSALGYGTALLIFDDHIAVGVGCIGLSGWYYEVDGAKYYYCETTGLGWDIGEMPEEYDEAYVLEVEVQLGAPVGLAAEAGDGAVTLSWFPPNSDGGAAIDHYMIYQDGEQVAVVEGTSAIVDDLINGVDYTFTVTANNALGEGPASSPVTVTPVGEGDLPGTPTDLEVTNRDGSVTLSWTAPEEEGATEIDYYVIYQDGEQVAVAEDTSVTIEDLENGLQYLFTVAAHNSVGIGPRASAVVAEPGLEDGGVPFWSVLILLLLAACVIVIAVIYVQGKKRAERAALSQQHPPHPPLGYPSPQNYGLGKDASLPAAGANPIEAPQNSPDDLAVSGEGAPVDALGTLADPAPSVGSQPLPAPKFCMNCGSPLSGEGSFCSNCGSRIR